MDVANVDSDHSMTWEDFFGSTTDLTPTLIGIYDSLLEPEKSSKAAAKSETTAKDARNVPPKPPRETEDNDIMSNTNDNPICNSSNTPVFASNKMETSSTTVANTSSLYHIRKADDSDTARNKQAKAETKNDVFGNLSSNVKRMISTADTSSSPLKFQKKSTSAVRASGRRSNIPLVGATSKIAQSREILPTVEIYDQPTIAKKGAEDSPIKKLKPEFRIDAQTYDIPTNNKPVEKTGFESLSLPFIDQSIELPQAEREFDTKISPKEADSGVKSPKNLRRDAPKLPKSEPYPQGIGSTGDLKVEEKEAKLNPPSVEVSRPLSMSSIVSSSSSSSGVQNKGVNSAYLASIESLDDHSDDLTSANGSSNFVNDAGVQEMPRPEYLPRAPEELSGLSQLERVCAEIIHTENVYVRDLQQVVEGYLNVWKKEMAFSEEDLDELFNNIEDIYHFNGSFCAQLNTCKLDAICIARCFVANTGGFGVYTSYCTGYPKTMERLAALASKPQFRERQIALGHPLPLASYLLKPVQRILKYHLLLQNVVKQCSSHETEYALSQMTGIAQHIDDMKRKHEHAVRVQEIQSLLYGWHGPDLTTYGELCAEGTFRVLGARGMRHVFLFDKMLLITKNREDGILAYKSHIMCNNMMLVESISGLNLSFHVIPWDRPRQLTTLHSPSHTHKRQWTLLLKRVILENYNAVIPSHARQLVMELGQNKTDDDIIAEKSHNLISQASMRKQLSAPEYLEKRKLERDRRKSFENDARRKKPTKKTLTIPSKNDLTQVCDCPQISAEKGVDYTCDACYIDLCSDCEEKEDKCSVCDRSLVLNASAENLDRKDYLSSQESVKIGKNITTSMTDVSFKTCLKCSRLKDVDRSRRLEVKDARSKSKDDQRSRLSKIGTWRRKSEPNRVQVALAAKRTQDKLVGSEKCEFLCRNCGSNKINREKNEEGVMSDPEVEHRKAKNLEIRMYNSKNVPKKISKLKKSRAKAKFYADLSKDTFVDSVLHISESNDSLNAVAKEENPKLLAPICKDEDIDEETYKKLIEKTDSFKKNELEKVKYLNQQKVIDEVSNAEIESTENEEITQINEETEQPLEHIISQLLMQNREFQKLLKKQQLRNINNKRHGILLKSHSYPEQSSKSPTRKKSEASIRELSPQKEIEADEDHIYETLRVTDPTPVKPLSSKLGPESDYVYLSFDKLNDTSEGIYDVPIKSPEKTPKREDYYVTMEKGPLPKKADHVYDIVSVNKDSKRKQGDYLSMSPEKIAQRTPNAPEIWLSDQKEHFNVPRDRKSGSLPRSFQVNNPEEDLSTFKGKTYLNREGKVINADRPFTIASDQGEIGHESVENYISGENSKFNKNLKSDTLISQSTLELEDEIDRCYKNNFETVKLSIKTDKLDISENNMDVSITSSCEGLPPNQIDAKNIEVIHPEHKIYKSTGNVLSLKNVLSRFKHRNPDKNDESDNMELSPEHDRKGSPNEKKSGLNPRSYSKNLLQRFRSIIGDEPEEIKDAIKTETEPVKTDIKVVITSTDTNATSVVTDLLSKSVCEQTTLTESQSEKNNLEVLSHSCDDIAKKEDGPKYERSSSIASTTSKKSSLKLPVYMQGSKHLGARIAQSDYLDPKTLCEKSDLKHVNVLINRNSVRPDSLFSNSSFVTTSSEGNDGQKVTEIVTKVKETVRRNVVVPDESYYEKSFEKIEKITDDDVFRDSAVYSDHEDEIDAKNKDKKNADAVKRNTSFKMEYVTARHSVSEIKANLQTRITLTSKVSEMKPKTPPPLPAKPKITQLPTKTGLKASKPESVKNINVKRNTSFVYAKSENFAVKNESGTENIQFKRTTERASLDSSIRKSRPNTEGETTKSVLERRMEIESLTKSQLKPRPAQPLTKKPSQLVKPKSITSKVSPYERSPDVAKNDALKPTTSKITDKISDEIKTEEEKGSWVKTVVNKFQ